MTAVPCRFMRASTENSRAISRFSSAAVGSSRMKTRHRRRSALAIATSWRSAKPREATRARGSGWKSSCASTSRASSRMRARSTMASGPKRRTGRSASATFSAIDSAGTRRRSCGMVTMPTAMASRGLAKWHSSPSRRTTPRSGRWTPPRMRISVDLPAPFSPTMAWISPYATSKSTPLSATVAPNRLVMPSALAAGPVIASTRNECHLHLRVGELAAFDDHVVVERNRAVAHRHVVMPLGRALAAALGVGTGREQKISGKAARAGVVALGVGAVERDRVPAPLRVEPPAEMRDGMTVEVVRARLVAFEPIVHELGIEPALDLADETVANVEPHLVLHVTAIGQHDDVAGGEHHGAVGRAFVRKSMHVTGTPVVKAARLLRISVLNHVRKCAELHREVGAAGARDAHGLGAFQLLCCVYHRLLEARGRHQHLELVGTVDDHEHPRAGLARLLEPAREQRDVQTHQHVGRLDRLERALAASDGLDPDLGPRRHGVDAHLVGVGAELLGRGEGGGDVIPPRPEVAQQHDGLALAHVAKLEFLAEEHRELGVVQRFVHGVPPPAKPCSVLILRSTHCERTARPDYRARVSKDGGSPDRGLMLRDGGRRRPPQHEAVESMRPNGGFHNSCCDGAARALAPLAGRGHKNFPTTSFG